VKIVKVESRSELRAFIDLPYTKYFKHPYWVPPLKIDERAQLDREKDPFFEHAEMDLYLAKSANRVVGRVAAIHDHLHEQVHGEKITSFGFYEAEDPAVAELLMSKVEEWARQRKDTAMRGPFNPSLNHTAGFQIDAFDEVPFLMTPYTPPEYLEHMRLLGYEKTKDLFAWHLDYSVAVDPRLERVAQRVQRQKGMTIRHLDMKAFDRELATVLEILSLAWADNWGFISPTDREFAQLARQLKMVIDPKLVLFAETEGETVAFSVTLPDFNQILRNLNGKLFPFGLVRLLLGRRRIDRVRMPLLGIRPEYRGKGLFAPLIMRSIDAARAAGFKTGECSWVLEDNVDMNRAIETLGAEHYKTYRIFQKNCSWLS
jgi:GNAT superfamily N-acetyltransferase